MRELLLTAKSTHSSLMRLLRKRSAAAAKPAPWDALRTQFEESLQQMQEAARVTAAAVKLRGGARTAAQMKVARAEVRYAQILTDTAQARHTEALSSMIRLLSKELK